MIAELRQTIGQEGPLPQFNTEATADAIRHFALGRGDDNPLYCDKQYATNSRFGDLIAPNTFVFTVSKGLYSVAGTCFKAAA